MNLGKVEEKFEKKNIFIKDFDLNREKTNYKGVIYVTTIHRDRTCWKNQYYHRSKRTLMVVKFCFVCWI